MDFQPFSVSCVTCGSRLRITRPDLMDTIVACPKCQGMVQLSRPEQGSEGTENREHPPAAAPPISSPLPQPPVALGKDPVDSAALTEDSLSPPSGLDHGHTSPSGFTEPPPTSDEIEAGFRTDQPTADHEVAGESGAVSGERLPPDWQSQRNAKSRRWALVVAVALASLVSLALLIGVVLRNRDSGIQVAENSRTEAESEGALDAASETEFRDDAESIEQDSQNKESGTGQSDNSDPDQGSEMQTEATESTEEMTDPNTNAGKNQTAPLGNEAETETKNQPQIPKELLPEDPLAGLLAGPFDAGKAPEEQGQNAPSMTELPEDIRKLLGPIDGLSRPHIQPNREAPPTLDEVQLERAADENVVLDAVVKTRNPINMRQAMGLELWFNTKDPKGYPLNDFALLISQLTRVPVNVQWVAFDLAQIPIGIGVKPPRGRQPVTDVLKAVCDSIDAEYIVDGETFRIQPTPERTEQAITEMIDLSDLGDGTREAVSTARNLLRQEPGDPTKLTVPVAEGKRQLAALICESIRRARGQKGKMDDSIAARWIGSYQAQVNAWPLLKDGVSAEALLHDIPLASLVRRVARANGATCYVHWSDLAKRGVGPEFSVMPKLGDQVNASMALNQVLQPEKMQVRVADAQHWWLGSEASFDRLPVAVWFDQSKDANATREKIESIIGEAFGVTETYANVTVDQTSGVCLAILPRFILQQLPRLLK